MLWAGRIGRKTSFPAVLYLSSHHRADEVINSRSTFSSNNRLVFVFVQIKAMKISLLRKNDFYAN